VKLEVTYPDAERLMVDHLEPLLTDATVSIGVPPAWETGVTDTPHLEVALDGTPSVVHPFAQRATIRLIARASSPTDAKALAQLAHGHALAGNWPDGISNVRPLTGPTPARDPHTEAELAAVTVQVTVRSDSITGS
jgi:hypothetical protein